MKKIILTKGKVALVDDEDFEYLNHWKWQANKSKNTWYAIKSHGGKMHQLIINIPNGFEIDHKDRNGLNNQKSNLRIATRAQNNANQILRSDNRSGLKSVCWHKRIKKWQVRLQVNGKRFHLGYFNDKNEAAKIYNTKAKELLGDFVFINQI